MLVPLESLSAVLVTISSKYVSICDRLTLNQLIVAKTAHLKGRA